MKIVHGFVAIALMAMLSGLSRAQIQLHKLVPSDLGETDAFGVSAISGDWVIAGNDADDENAQFSGAVYLYHRETGGWVQHQKVKANDPAFGDGFGTGVAISGIVAAVGADGASLPGHFDCGAIYVLELIEGTWVETAKLFVNDPQPNAHLGHYVAIDGDRILASSTAMTAGRGAAYVFERTGNGWTQTAKLTANDALNGDAFGRSVAISGNVIGIGAIGVDSPSINDAGAAYIFEYNGTSWLQVAKLMNPPGDKLEYYGESVAVTPTRCLVGAAADDHAVGNAGALYAFERLGGVWTQTQQIFALGASNGDQMGNATAISGDLAVCATWNDDDMGPNSGSTRLFKYTQQGWTEIGKLLAHDGSPSDSFGRARISGSYVVVHSSGDDDACSVDPNCNSGAAYIFEIAPDARQYGHCIASPPCSNYSDHGGCLNSIAHGATLGAAGSSSIASDGLRIEGRLMPANKAAIVFVGNGQNQAPLGDGIKVVSTGSYSIRRFHIQQTDIDGALTLGPGLLAQLSNSPIAPGSIWNFQCWYRDPTGPCLNGTNLTNGVEITFTP